jgi:hypothetical protein
MKRYNIFNQVHKGLKALLYETALLLQHTHFKDADAADSAIMHLEMVVELFELHAHTEDSKVFAPILQFDDKLVHAFEQEHQEDNALVQQLRGLCTAYVHAISTEEKNNIGSVICQSFERFMIFNLVHMAKEEDLMNKALWKRFTDKALMDLTQKIVADLSPTAMAQFSKWMMRGLNNVEIVNWLKEVKNTAPDFVFQSLMQIAATNLHPNRWQMVQEEITEGAMIA